MKKIITCSIMLFVASMAFAFEAEVPGFRNHTWGEKMSSFGALEKTHPNLEMSSYRKIGEDLKFLGLQAEEIHYDFYLDGDFIGASVYYAGGKKMCKSIMGKLNKIYGSWNDRKEGVEVYYWEKWKGDITLECDLKNNIISVDYDRNLKEPPKRDPASAPAKKRGYGTPPPCEEQPC